MVIRSRRYVHGLRRRPPCDEADYLWVFLVATTDSERSWGDTIATLARLHVEHAVVLPVVAAEDQRSDELTSVDAVIVPAQPSTGDAQHDTLNAAHSYVTQGMQDGGPMAGWSPTNVVLVLLDDVQGLSPRTPSLVARHLNEPLVGAVQAGVTICPTLSWLTRMQAVEADVWTRLQQPGRSLLGTAELRATGQFLRLQALDSARTEAAPWPAHVDHEKELVIRLLGHGWRVEHCPHVAVDRSPETRFGVWFRRRSQHMQAEIRTLSAMRQLYSHNLVGVRRFDAWFSLAEPLLQGIVGLAVALLLLLGVLFRTPALPFAWPVIVVLAMVLFIGPLGWFGVATRRGLGWRAGVVSLLRMPSYAVYCWLRLPITLVAGVTMVWQRLSRWWTVSAGGAHEQLRTDELR